MTTNLSPLAGAGQQFFTDTGSPLTGGKLYSYIAGTTTPQTTFTNPAGSVAHTNPIILNAAGRVATGEIWITSGVIYKFVLYTSTDVLIASWDNLTGINGTGIATNAVFVEYDPASAGAVTTTVQAKLRESVSVTDYGAVGDGVTDNYAAIMAAINSATYGTGFRIQGPAVYFPPGNYYCSQTINLKRSVKLYGDGSGLPDSSPASIIFPAGVTGIIVNRFNTIGAITEIPTTTAADGSTIEGLTITGAFGTADAAGGNGIWLRARANLRNLTVLRFTGNGVRIEASSGGAFEGNANVFNLNTIYCVLNGEWGVYIDGADVNAGVATGLNVSANGTGGVFDGSFLGNTHLAHHAATNGAANAGYNTIRVRTSLVSFGGNRYYGNVGATASDLVATTPGTDETIWALEGAGAPGSAYLLWVAASPLNTYFVSAQYQTDSNNARNVFVGCYAEGGYSPSFFVRPTLILGGLITAVGGANLTSTTTTTVVPETFETETLNLGYLAERDSGQFIKLPDTAGGNFNWTQEKAVGRIGWKWANLSTPGFVNFFDRTATITNGYARSLVASNGALGISAYYFGTTAQMLFRTAGTAAPSTGTHNQGDIVYDTTPSASGFIGFVCTTSGTFGTLNSGATTGGITIGTTLLVVNSATGLTEGCYITIAGVSGIKQVTAISGLNITITTSADATVAAAPVAFSAAVYKTWGPISA